MAGERKPEWKPLSGIDIPQEFPGQTDFSGQPPYTVETLNNVSVPPLDNEKYPGFLKCKETNERFKLLLERGKKGLSVAFDLPLNLA
ncbi:MAG: hypothetical protein CM15mP8_3470 [Methanobacteriota archaeon]|nr:MAG: hypothetical protein CM15mP8_3470 [Euryarchaeota archaeon]